LPGVHQAEHNTRLTMIKAAVRKRKFLKRRKQKRKRTDMDHLKNNGEQEMTARTRYKLCFQKN
jgi:hypothetical protein